jgi:membrane associated rhomboid family serine protease
MRRGSWPVLGLVLGAMAGAFWGWFGSGGYEANDSAIGTSFLGALGGLLIGAVASTVAARRDRKRRRGHGRVTGG